jgi:hypothetical protein
LHPGFEGYDPVFRTDAELEALATDERPVALLVDENGELIAGYHIDPAARL